MYVQPLKVASKSKENKNLKQERKKPEMIVPHFMYA